MRCAFSAAAEHRLICNNPRDENIDHLREHRKMVLYKPAYENDNMQNSGTTEEHPIKPRVGPNADTSQSDEMRVRDFTPQVQDA